METFSCPTRFVFGRGSLANLGIEIKKFSAKKVLIVTDKGLMSTGIIQKVTDILDKEGIESVIFDEVQADPAYAIASEVAKIAVDSGAELMLGIGGGSSLDITKVASILVTNTGNVKEYFGVEQVPLAGLPTILIPTTAGTGSEVTNIAILSVDEDKIKVGVVSRHMFTQVALLDPELTVGLPPSITAATGLDALIHGIEAFTSRNGNPMTDLLAIEGIKLISENLRTAYADGDNIEARTAVLRGALYTGMAFNTAGCAAVHAFALSIGGAFHVPHGIANSIMLAPVMKFNFSGNLKKYAKLAELLGEKVSGCSDRKAAFKGLKALKALIKDINVPQHLAEFGVKESDIPSLAKGVLTVQRLLNNNPRKLTLADAENIIKEAL